MAAALENEFKVPVEWLEDESHNTAENAVFTVALLQQQQIDTIILVTAASHMPRAAQSFSRQGVTVIAAPTGFVGGGGSGFLDWLPSAGALSMSRNALHEYLGSLVYALLY